MTKKGMTITKRSRAAGRIGFDGARQVGGSGEEPSRAFAVPIRKENEGLGSESNLTIPACPQEVANIIQGLFPR